MQTNAPLVLASASPRRRLLLDQIGLQHSVRPVNLDETVREGEGPLAYTRRLAEQKTRACETQEVGCCLVLAADTTVCIDSDILGKPENKAHALSMLRRLSGRSHEVVTSFALLNAAGFILESCITKVHMTTIEDAEFDAYWASGEPTDKAGAYAIQGLGAVFVERIEGSYSNVVGLPLYELTAALRRIGMLRAQQ